MKCVEVLLLWLLCVLEVVVVRSCPSVCSCAGSVVDCSGRRITTSSLPSSFPPDTTELLLHDNHLTALPNGLLDTLSALRLATLHGNPWACDCGALYLRGWLLKQKRDVLTSWNISCNYPPDLRGRLLMDLVEEEVLSSCHYWLCDLALASQISLIIFIFIQVLLLASIIFFLRRFDRLSREAHRTADETIAAGHHATEGHEYVTLK